MSNIFLLLSQFPTLFLILSLILQSKEVDAERIIESQVRDKSVNDTVKYIVKQNKKVGLKLSC